MEGIITIQRDWNQNGRLRASVRNIHGQHLGWCRFPKHLRKRHGMKFIAHLKPSGSHYSADPKSIRPVQ